MGVAVAELAIQRGAAQILGKIEMEEYAWRYFNTLVRSITLVQNRPST
jgi:hypothetical protein